MKIIILNKSYKYKPNKKNKIDIKIHIQIHINSIFIQDHKI